MLSIAHRFRCWQWCVVVLLMGQPIWFFLLRGPRILNSDITLFTGWIVFSGVILLIAWLLKTTTADAIKWPIKQSVMVIMLGAAWLHLHAIVWLWPGLSDDALRYRSDGQMWQINQSPYAHRPVFTHPFKEHYAHIPNAHLGTMFPFVNLHTIYLPTSQIVFYGLKQLDDAWPGEHQLPASAPPSWRQSLKLLDFTGRLFTWRLGFGAMIVIATAFIAAACVQSGRSPWWAVLLGWHPLAIVETSGMAHQDAIGILCLAAAMWAFGRFCHQPKAVVSGLASGLCLALACGVKPLAIVLAPFWFIARPNYSWVTAFCITGLLLSTLIFYQHGYVGLLETLRLYTQTWEANASIYHVISTQFSGLHVTWTPVTLFFEPAQLGRIVAAVVGCGVALAAVIGRWHWTTAYYFIVLTSLLLAPVVYGWYLLWLLVIVPFTPRLGLTALVFCGTIVLNYHLWRTPGWVMPWSWLAMEYVPVYGALIYEVLSIRAQQKPSDNR
jgi:hypothetical protein